MPLPRPTLVDIKNRVDADFKAAGLDASIRGSIEFAVANALAGIAHSMYGYAGFTADQLFDDTADLENLTRRASKFGVFRTPGSVAKGQVKFTGSNDITIPAETLIEAGNIQYTTLSAITISAGEAIADIESLNIGTDKNLPPGATLTLVNPIAGVQSEAEVVNLSAGSDDESISRFRSRFAERKQQPPAGGADYDYVAWAKQAHPDVERVFVQRLGNGLGTVAVFLLTSDASNPQPSSSILEAVYNYIDQPDIRPAGMKAFTVAAPDLYPVDITFSKLSPNTAAVQQAVYAELQDVFFRDAKMHLDGDNDGILPLSHIHEAISNAAGEYDYTINLTSDISPPLGSVAVLGEVTWP